MDAIRLPIVQVDIYGVAVPLVGPGFRNAYLTKTSQKSAVVRLVAQDGTIGLGNIDPSPGYSAETIEQSLAALRDRLAPAVQGLDAGNLHALVAAMDTVLVGHLDAKAAIEMAAVDLLSRRLGIPVYQFLGGKVRDEVQFNAWVGIVSPDEAASEARRWFDRGFRSAKVKVGGGIRADRDRLLVS